VQSLHFAQSPPYCSSALDHVTNVCRG